MPSEGREEGGNVKQGKGKQCREMKWKEKKLNGGRERECLAMYGNGKKSEKREAK